MLTATENRPGRNAAMDVRNHPSFDFSTLWQVQAPSQPPLTSDVDTSRFPVGSLPQDLKACLCPRRVSVSRPQSAPGG
ncbi:hypothetical protein QBC39DRAFT_341244 [Podospora conica]|nr:hypothetical protein QBC39DRAFT_341244 [Schizothecium conicum]